MLDPITLRCETEVRHQHVDDLDQTPALVDGAGVEHVDAAQAIQRATIDADVALELRHSVECRQSRGIYRVLNEAHAHREHDGRADPGPLPFRDLHPHVALDKVEAVVDRLAQLRLLLEVGRPGSSRPRLEFDLLPLRDAQPAAPAVLLEADPRCLPPLQDG